MSWLGHFILACRRKILWLWICDKTGCGAEERVFSLTRAGAAIQRAAERLCFNGEERKKKSVLWQLEFSFLNLRLWEFNSEVRFPKYNPSRKVPNQYGYRRIGKWVIFSNRCKRKCKSEFQRKFWRRNHKDLWEFSASASVMCTAHVYRARPHLKPIFHFAAFTFSLCCRHCRGGEVISCNVCLFPLFYEGDVLDCKAAQLVDLHEHTSRGICIEEIFGIKECGCL